MRLDLELDGAGLERLRGVLAEDETSRTLLSGKAPRNRLGAPVSRHTPGATHYTS
jgi:hypothetical protein